MNQTDKKTKKLKNRLFKSMRKIKKDYILFRNNPYQPENILQLRVKMRKMRAHLHFLKPILKKKDYKRINGTLRGYLKGLGTIREVDAF